MGKLKIYSVKDEYIRYLEKYETNIYSNKEDERVHSRKYVGVVLEINNYLYYIPMSSPKKTDYVIVNGDKVIKKSNLTIIRIIDEINVGVKELKGTLRISNMIPVPKSQLMLYDVNNEKDIEYKKLILKQLIFITKYQKLIIKYARIIYNQKTKNQVNQPYIKAVLDFKKLENLHDLYIKDHIG